MPFGVRVESYANSVWTAQDEQQFVEMQQRRERVTTKRREALIKVMTIGVSRTPDIEVVDHFIANAGAIRDALEPYDSGIREVMSDSRPE